MDIQRIVLFAGLAIVSYLMVLAWNEDYHQPQTEQVAEAQSPSDSSATSTDDMILPEDTNAGGEEFATPETSSLAATSANGDQDLADRFITVTTDVYELKIDRVGGNLVDSCKLVGLASFYYAQHNWCYSRFRYSRDRGRSSELA